MTVRWRGASPRRCTRRVRRLRFPIRAGRSGGGGGRRGEPPGAGALHFLLHAIAFSDKEELKGQYLNTTRDNFLRTLDISCFSFTDLCRRAAPLMALGGGLLALPYV